MKISWLMRLTCLFSLIAFLAALEAANAAPVPDKDGTLVVIVTWGDVANTPAKDVYVEAHGYVAKFRSEKSFVFKMVHSGRYEASLPPGVYDVFISDGISEPRCRRMRVASDDVSTWTLKLEMDEIYTEH